MDIAAIEALAKEIAKTLSFTYAGNFGRGEFTFEIKVSRDNDYLGNPGDTLRFTAPTNACISEKRAKDELHKFWTELLSRLDSKDGLKSPKQNGYLVWRVGFMHMGRLCTTGFTRALRKIAVEQAA